MSQLTAQRSIQEVELKLALPVADTTGLLDALLVIPVLNGLVPQTVHLHNIYYDTPDQQLHQKRIALRLRRTGTPQKPKWLQTLKTSAINDSALSQRGEWESPVKHAMLDRKALRQTAWSNIDPDGLLFEHLAPCFVTTFERTTWLVQVAGGEVEVALDTGCIQAGDRSAPIAELELELKAGSTDLLFQMARLIAQHVVVLPASLSKAERGYALAANKHNAALAAKTPDLDETQTLPMTARRVMREMFSQFTGNLALLPTSDDAELVHQARIGWRRFTSAARLFQSVPGMGRRPEGEALKPLCKALGLLRDLDVARMEVLPQYAQAFVSGNSERACAWAAMDKTLGDAAGTQRERVLRALLQTRVGDALLEITHWLEAEDVPASASVISEKPAFALKQWARRSVKRLHTRLDKARKTAREANSPKHWHRVRLLAKRLRYAIEAFQKVLPKKRVHQWHHEALRLQAKIGSNRDVVRAAALVAGLAVDSGLVGYLRGIATDPKVDVRSLRQNEKRGH